MSGGYNFGIDGDSIREPLVNLATGPVNDPPTVAIAVDPFFDVIVDGTVLITATADDTDGTVKQVEMRDRELKLLLAAGDGRLFKINTTRTNKGHK